MTLPFDALFGLPTPVFTNDLYNNFVPASGSVTADTGVTDPDGTTLAYKIKEDTSTGPHGVYRLQTFASATHTVMFFAKANDFSWLFIDANDTITDSGVSIDLATPAIGSAVNAGLTNVRVDALANSWVLVTARFTGNGISGQTIGIFLATGNSATSFTGTGTTRGINVWGFRVYASALSTATITGIADYYKTNTWTGSGLWTPATSGAPATGLWLDAFDSASITHASNIVSQWNDKSGNARHASQSTGGLKPTYSSSAANGRGAIVFSSHILNLASSIVTGTAWMVFAVAKLTDNSNLLAYFLAGTAVGHLAGGTFSGGYNTATFDGTNFRSAAGSTPAILNTRRMLGFEPAKIWHDGVEPSYRDTNTMVSMTLTAVGDRPDFPLAFLGEINELIFVPSTLSDPNRELFEGYLAWKWGMDGNLPSGHTYQLAAPTASNASFPPFRASQSFQHQIIR